MWIFFGVSGAADWLSTTTRPRRTHCGRCALDTSAVDHPIGHLPDHLMAEVTAGLRLVLGLSA